MYGVKLLMEYVGLLVRARERQSRGRRFDSGKTPKNRELKCTWI